MYFVANLPFAKEGTWLYAASVPVRVRILFITDMSSTGDPDDYESIRELFFNDSNGSAFAGYFLVYEMAGTPGVFRNIAATSETLELAVADAENKFPGIKWNEP